MSKVSVREAAHLTGRSRETINTATKDGILSFTLNERNHKVIDIAELERVYPIVNFPPESAPSEGVRDGQGLTRSGQSEERDELVVLRERVKNLTKEHEMLVSERERERRQLEGEIDHLRDSLKVAQENQSKAMLLLTHERQGEPDRGTDKLAVIEETVHLLKRQNGAIVRELRRRKVSWWRKLLGGGEPTKS